MTPVTEASVVVPTPTPTPVEAAELRRSIGTGVRWNTASTVCKQIARVGVSVVLARLLGPHSYGIVGQATVYILLISFLLDGGLGAAYVQKPLVDDDDRGAVWWYSVVASVLLAGVTLAIAPALAAFYHTPQLTAVLDVLSIDVLCLGLAIAPVAVLSRSLRLRNLAIAELSGNVLGSGIALGAAYAGASYWSLVVFAVSSDAIVLLVVGASAGRPRLRTTRAAIVGLWSYGTKVISTQILYFVQRNADNVLVGRYLGTTALGLYALAYRVLLLPQQTLGYMINRVSLPVFARLQDDRPRLGRYFLKATAAVAFVSFPILTLVAVSAPDAVPLVFGHRWLPAVSAMQILALAGFLTTTQHLLRPVLYAVGKPGLALRLQGALSATTVVGFGIGLAWGIVGVATALAIVLLAFTPVLTYYAAREGQVSLWRYLRALAPALTSSAAVALAYLLVSRAASGLGGWGQLLIGSVVSLTAYVALLRLTWPEDLSDAFAVVARARRRGPRSGRSSGQPTRQDVRPALRQQPALTAGGQHRARPHRYRGRHRLGVSQ